MEDRTYGMNGQGIPVLTYEELAGLVLGYNPWDLGLQYHNVQPDILLDKMNVEYSTEDKYLDREGKKLPEPEELIYG